MAVGGLRRRGRGCRRRLLELEGADVGVGAGDIGTRIAALVGGGEEAKSKEGGAGVDGGAAGQQGHGLGGAAVVGQGAQARVGGDKATEGGMVYQIGTALRPAQELLNPDPGGAGCVTWSPDGSTLAVGCHDRTVQLVDPRTGRVRNVLRGMVNHAIDVAFAPDDRTLASGGHDQSVKLWSVPAAAEVASLEAHQGKVHCLAFSPDGTTLATGGDDRGGWGGEVFLWRAPRPWAGK
jgi:hypothetical protein